MRLKNGSVFTGQLYTIVAAIFWKNMLGSGLDRLSENVKPQNFGIDIKGLMTRKLVKIPILGQPVESRIWSS